MTAESGKTKKTRFSVAITAPITSVRMSAYHAIKPSSKRQKTVSIMVASPEKTVVIGIVSISIRAGVDIHSLDDCWFIEAANGIKIIISAVLLNQKIEWLIGLISFADSHAGRLGH